MESRCCLRIKDPQIAGEYIRVRNREILYASIALFLFKVIMFVTTTITEYAQYNKLNFPQNLIRVINIPIHLVLLIINWRCSPKLYIFHGPILTVCAALPTLYLLYKEEEEHPGNKESIVTANQMAFVQTSLAIITALLTSGAYLLTSITLLSATAFITIIRNHNLDRYDKKDIVFISFYVLFMCYICWETEMRKKKDFI